MERYEVETYELSANDIIALCVNQRAAYELYRRRTFADKYLSKTGLVAEDEGGICSNHKISLNDIREMCAFINSRYMDFTDKGKIVYIDKSVYECEDINRLFVSENVEHSIDNNGFDILEITDRFWGALRMAHLADVVGPECVAQYKHLVQDPMAAADIKNRSLQIENIDIQEDPNAILENVLDICDVSGDLQCLSASDDFREGMAKKYMNYIEQDPQYYELRQDSITLSKI